MPKLPLDEDPFASVGVLYLRYHGSLVTAQKSRYDWFPPAASGWGTMHPVMRTCLSWIQPHPHEAILRHLLNTVNSFLCSSTNYFVNCFLPYDLIIIRNHGDDEEDERNIKRALERQGDVHIKVEIQSNSEIQSLTSSKTQSPGLPHLQIDV
jgi:hypothetical protein